MEQYRAFSTQEAIEYAGSLPGVFDAGETLSAEEIGDGNLNLVFRIRSDGSGRSVIVKQALPYVRVVGGGWPLSLDRARIESAALAKAAEVCPELVPQVYSFNQELALIVMEDLSDHIVLRKGLIQGKRYERLAEDLGTYMARTLFATSDLYLEPQAKKQLQVEFCNPELCKITEDLVFTHPYMDAETNNIDEAIRPFVARFLWSDTALKREVALLKHAFLTRGEALVHGDLHTGSVMVTAASTKVIDPEFAYYGPMGFDVGAMLANLLLNYVAQAGHRRDADECSAYRAYLLETVEQLWHQFATQLRLLHASQTSEEMAKTEGFFEIYLRNILQDSIGFAGCKMIRRIVGLAHVEDIDSISDKAIKTAAQELALRIGRELIMERQRFDSIEAVSAVVKRTEGA